MSDSCSWHADNEVVLYGFNGLSLSFFTAVGHGRSEGVRIDIDTFDSYVRDLLAHAEDMKKQYPSLPLFLMGHSMVC